FEAQVRRLHEQSAEHALYVQVFAMDRLRMKAHHASVLFLAQKFEHAGLERSCDQHLCEKFIHRLRKAHVPWAVGDYDTAERRIGIGREGFFPRLEQRTAKTDTARRVVLEDCDDGFAPAAEIEHQVDGRADIENVVERKLAAVKLLRDL